MSASASDLHPPTHLVSLDKKPLYDIYVKGSPEKGELGDCPFSHRMMLTMQEKGVAYNMMLLDEQKLPEWIKEVADGNQKIPFMLELDTAKWLYDSDKMYPYLEEKYTSKKLGSMESLPDVGKDLMPTRLMEFLMSKPGKEQEEKEAALLSKLKEINDHLTSSGPLFGGNDVNGLDVLLGPQLKHTVIATKTIKNWDVPKSLEGIWKFFDVISQRESWKNTYYTEKYVQDGWKLKVKMMSES